MNVRNIHGGNAVEKEQSPELNLSSFSKAESNNGSTKPEETPVTSTVKKKISFQSETISKQSLFII